VIYAVDGRETDLPLVAVACQARAVPFFKGSAE